ncbi:hypothetical protein [Thauera aminoaromatica]|jgi:hypothetical protein|uniref:Uncharacterized protein n=1 Tax=Thauera aminoaromatica TaxID=164330 RepID=A0A5C7S6G5_THASP|nr:hypothetical protein [Thauera aminoaromatica]MBK7285298.1 hypothetical protein [Sphingomonadales bacterium]MBP8276178.1 hypothetical protein [Propionivibrio sp.]TXH79508.1 MAG: hypothetical protein E6Q80_20290 [Thauera aminoaromatica]
MNHSTRPNNEFLMFVRALRDELMSMSDEDVLASSDLEQLRARRARMLQDAKKEAGRRRLAAAKARLQSSKAGTAAVERIDPTEARQYIARAANDERYTLVARQLGEGLSDEEAVRLYRQMRSLEQGQSEDES